MTVFAGAGDGHSDGHSAGHSGEIVIPSSEMWAIVRHAEPPQLVPDELLPYVMPSYVESVLDDWSLTDDAVAFGDVDIPMAYQRWRATWERSWCLDPRANLRKLTAIARDVARELDLASTPLLDLVGDERRGARIIDGPDELLRLATELERLRDAIRARGTSGYGFVDVTEGRSRVGLARAWSPAKGAELLAADASVRATMEPELGLRVELAGPTTRVLEGVEEVAVRATGVEVTHADGVDELPPESAVALTWIVPGAARWRVRRVPEVLVWARTFAGLPEGCRYAAALRRALVLRDGDGSSAPTD